MKRWSVVGFGLVGVLGVALLLLAPSRGGQLVTNDGSFFAPVGCASAAPVPTPLTINTITQVIPSPSNPNAATYICQWSYGVQSIVGAASVVLSYGSGTNCATGNTLLDSASMYDGNSVTAGEYVSPYGFPLVVAPVNTAVCLEQLGTSGTLVNTGSIKYVQR